jgi:hypothetical protein
MILYINIKACTHTHTHTHTHTCNEAEAILICPLQSCSTAFFIQHRSVSSTDLTPFNKMFSKTACCRQNPGICVVWINGFPTGVFKKNIHSSCTGHLNSYIKNWCIPKDEIENCDFCAFRFRVLHKYLDW